MDYSYRFLFDDIKMAGKKKNIPPMWKKLMKRCCSGRAYVVFRSRVLGRRCTQRECKPNETDYWRIHK